MNSLKPTDAQWSALSDDKKKEYNKYHNDIRLLNKKLSTIIDKYPVEKRFSGESFMDDNDKKLVKEYNRQIVSLTRKANAIVIGTNPNKTDGGGKVSDALDSMSYKWQKKTEELNKENDRNEAILNSPTDKEKEKKEEAAKEKTRQSKDEVDIAIQVKNIAHNLIKMKLEQSLDEELDKLASSGNVSEETKKKMRLIIRNQKTVESMHSTLITLAEAKTEKILNKYFKDLEKKIFGKTGAKIEKSAKKIDNVIGDVDRFDKKAQKLADMTPKKFTKYLTKNLDQLLESKTGYGEICSKLDNAINNNKISQFIGFGGFSTSQVLAPVINNIEHQIASKLTAKLQPVIQKYLGQVQGIVGTVLNFKNQILASIQSFKSAIKNLKNLAVSYAKNFVSNLANKALSAISGKLNIGGLGSGAISANAAFSGRSDALGTA